MAKTRTGRPTALVIGAGLGGIACAARLARAGWRVTVLEKNEGPGGRASEVWLGRYRFDAGPTILLAPDLVAETWTSLGACLPERVPLRRVDPTSRLFFGDGSRLELPADPRGRRVALAAFGADAPDAVERYLGVAGEHYRVVRRLFLEPGARQRWRSPGILPSLLRLHAWVPLATHARRFLRDPRLHAALTYQAMYVGGSPFEVPATLSLIAHLEHVEGVFYPVGGLFALVTSLVELAEAHGVTFRYGSPVAGIIAQGDRVDGVELEGGERLAADVVVANADLPYVFERLLPRSIRSLRVASRPMGASAIVFLWGVRGPRERAFAHHNSFLVERGYRRSFQAIFSHRDVPEDPSFYLAAPSRTDPDAAPPDGDAWMVLVPAGHLDGEQRQPWPERVARARRQVLARLAVAGVPDLASRIEAEAVIAPPDYAERWNLSQGSAFGLAHTLGQMAWLRPGQRHPSLRNLFLVGASTQPGSGIPNVLVSARQVAGRILGRAPGDWGDARPCRRLG